MTTIAILGSGRVGRTLAAGFAAAGHDVVVGSRDPEAATAAWADAPAEITTVADAVARAEVVVNASPGDVALGNLSALRSELEGKVLIDVSNATEKDPSGAPGDLLYPNGSLAENLQRALPATRVVKTLNTMLFPVMTAPGALAHPATAFLSGDDADAKATTAGLLADLGWKPEQLLDLGGIASARGPEALMLLVPYVLRARGFAPIAIGVQA
jgi:predicted dinucleotide-binding enzyme